MKRNAEELMRPCILKIPPYIPGRGIKQASEENGGIEMVKMSSNENNLGPSPKAIAAMQEACKTVHVYPDPKGDTLNKRIAEYFDVDDDMVLSAAGSSQILETISKIFLNPGDEVIFCAPTFSVYGSNAVQNDAVPIKLELDDELKFDLDAMKAAITDKTKLIQICNPNNPTASFIKSGELLEFIKGLPDHIVTVVDEAYIDFADDPDCTSMIPYVKDYNIIVARTFAKIYGLAALRAGYCIASPEIITHMKANLLTFNVGSVTSAACVASLDDEEYRKLSYEHNKKYRKIMRDELIAMGLKVWPSQTNFLCITDMEEEPKVVAKKLEEKGVIVRGNFPGILRVTVSTEEENNKFLAAMKEYLEELKK